MPDFLNDFLYDVFSYFFKINAPFTMIIFIFGVLLFFMWKKSGKAEKIKIEHAVASEIFNAQMDHYDDSVGELHQLLLSNFMSLRKKTLIDIEIEKIKKRTKKDITKKKYEDIEKKIKTVLGSDGEVHRFNEILGNVKTVIKPIFRRVYKLNHLAEKKNEAFEIHISSRVDHVISKFTEELDHRYWDGTKPDRITLYDSQQLLIPECREILKNILRHGKEISIEYRKNKKLKTEHFLTEAIKG